MASGDTLIFIDATWEREVLNATAPVLVDFWAEWCPPCRTVSPTIDAIAGIYLGRVKVGKLNVDDNRDTQMGYNVRSIPTLLLFKSGKIVEQRVSAAGRTEIQKMIDAHL